jgi:hypothetical protein
MALVSVRRAEMAVEVKGALGFRKSDRYILAQVIWAGTVHNTSPEITEWPNGP